MGKTIRLAIIIFVLGTGLSVLGADGLIVERADGSVEYFGSDVVCTTSPEGIYSVIRDGRILMVYTPGGKYWLGSAADWCSEMKNMMSDMETVLGGNPANYTIQAQGVETVGGRPATRYSILFDGESIHDVWVNEEAQVTGTLKKLESSLDYMDCAESDGIFEVNGLDFQPAVNELEEKGLIVKRQDPYESFDNPHEGETVTSIRFGPLPADKLSLTPPANLKPASSIMSLFGAM